MDAMRVLSNTILVTEGNGSVGRHRFLIPNSALPCLGIDKPISQLALCNIPSLSNKFSLRRGEVSVLKPRKPSRNYAVKINIRPETKPSKKENVNEYYIDGEVVLQKVALFNFTDFSATLADFGAELMGNKVYLQLVSSDQVDPETGSGKTADEVSFLDWNAWDGPLSGDTHYSIKFKWNSTLGFPGAFLIKNTHAREFFLKSLSISIPGHGSVRFHCNSWISPSSVNENDRVFFYNKSFLPEKTPLGLRKLRELDMESLQGDGTGERKVSDLIYDYDVYNDISEPDKSPQLRREVLGGSQDFPYPRRCRTGRPRVKTAPEFETRASLNYIPPDERFPHTDFSDFGANTIMAFANMVVPTIVNLFDVAFQSFEEVGELYIGGNKYVHIPHKIIRQNKNPLQIIQGLLDKVEDDLPFINFNRPQIVEIDEFAWRKDDEFSRQTLAGVNPLMIQCLEKFPPSGSLDEKTYGPQKSTITAQHIEKNLEGLSVDEAVARKKLFILDYYDAFMLYAERINKISDDVKTYASRTLFFLTKEGTLSPVAIELCLPPVDGNEAVRKVFTPAKDGTEEGALWQLTKAHVKSNDAGYHQLVSHWLRTHCITEPFIIATHRQLSRMHPVYKLLTPHYLNTMDINQAARQALINAGGIIEQGFTTGRYSAEMSSIVYKQWKFNEQGLPADLLARGMAVPDPKAPHGLRLAIEDYPYAVDGIEIWFGLKQWVSDYLCLFYKDDASVKTDKELQAWWDEIVNVGHGDLKDDPSRWYKMDSLDNAIQVITTIIWTTSAHHAAVNFGQYSYGGYMPNMPTMTRRLIPEKGTPEYDELLMNADRYFLKTVSTPTQATLIMGVLEILSKHSKNEVYLGQLQGSTMDRVDDAGVEEAFGRFSENMINIERNIIERNSNSH
ncbi:hypothetical protein KI387_007107, partial [Taxus chinensis]